MDAPGNSALIFTLLAVFVTCCSYAAGRIHQRRQTEDDRDQAYRDGYETATRSVFSLAARAVSGRRANRPGAVVGRSPAAGPGTPASAAGGAVAPGFVLGGSAGDGSGSASGGPVGGGQVGAGSVLGGGSAGGGSVLGGGSAGGGSVLGGGSAGGGSVLGGGSMLGLRVGSGFGEGGAVGRGLAAGESVRDGSGPVGPVRAGAAPGGSEGEDPAVGPHLDRAGHPAGAPVVTGSAATTDPFADRTPRPPAEPTGQSALLRRAATPGASPIPSSRRPSAGENDAASLGFPVPPPPSPRVVPEPPAVGGLVYRAFPDPRTPREGVLPPAEAAGDQVVAPIGPGRVTRSAPMPPGREPGRIISRTASADQDRTDVPTTGSWAPAANGTAAGHGTTAGNGAAAESGSAVGNGMAAGSGMAGGAAAAGIGVSGDEAVGSSVAEEGEAGGRRRGSRLWRGRAAGLHGGERGGLAGPARGSEHGAAEGVADGAWSFGKLAGLGMPGPGSGMPDAVVGALGAETGLAAESRVEEEVVEPESTGRHTVPDGLVQAATYRLPPDRIFRARVPGAGALPEEPTTQLPKPRQS